MAKSRGVLTTIVIFLGALFFLSGLIFTLQGLGIVGPGSSFMFRNNTWIYYGVLTLVVGLILVALGVAFRPRAMKNTGDTSKPVAETREEGSSKPS